MSNTELYWLSISEASDLISSGQLSPVELCAAHLDRIDQTDGALNSFITVMADQARAEARAAEDAVQAGNYRGPLHGIPVGLKDLYYTRGVRTGIGSKILADFVPDYDAGVTERFQDAGAVLMGKLQMHEFALGASSENPHDGDAHNPWNTSRVTGGSSGGSGSSVAAGQCMAALGSDTGGSIRIPSSFCGIVGLKPTFGRVSRHGVYPLAFSLDTVGPMTRTARDAGLVLNAIAGHDPRDPSSANVPVEDFTAEVGQGIDGLRIGLPQEYFYDIIDPEVTQAVKTAAGVLEELGAHVEEVSIPALDHALAISSTILFVEAAEVHMEHLRDRPDDIGDDVRQRFEVGALTPARDYMKAQRARRAFNAEMAKAMETYDVLLAPTNTFAAPPIGERESIVAGEAHPTRTLLARLTRPFNLTGQPGVSVPCGFDSAGMPIGMQFGARPWREATALRVAHAYEQATEWHTRRPPV